MTARPSVTAIVLCGLTVATATLAQPEERRLDARQILREAKRDRLRTVPVELGRQGQDLVIKAADAAVPVANADILPDRVQQLQVQAQLTFDPALDMVRIDKLTLDPVATWNARSDRDKDRFAVANAAHERLETVADRALAPDATEEDLTALAEQVQATQAAIVEETQGDAPLTAEDEAELRAQYMALRRTNKAIYRHDDRYRPMAYTRIYENSRGSLGLVRRGESQPICSGVLVGENLALTNFHCINTLLPEDLKVQFNYELDLDGSSLPSRSFPVTAFLASNSEATGSDFALLELGPDGPANEQAGQVFPPQCLSTVRVQRDDPLYLVGHPDRAPRTVHDNAFVYFPFRITKGEMQVLKWLVEDEFAGVEDAQAQIDSFLASYRAVNAGGVEMFEHHSQRFNGRPTIGADADTYHGNSGSPAYSRKTHDIVGILFAGEEDVTEAWIPGWRSHEAIVPITEVMRHLDGALPGWRSRPGVCIKG
jgi:hypothetical protein